MNQQLIDMASDFKKLMNETKKITPEEFELQIITLTCKHQPCITDFYRKELPIAPQDILKFRFLTELEKEKLLKEDSSFRQRKEEHEKSIEITKNTNQRNKSTLQSWLKIITPPNIHAKIENALNSYSIHNDR